MDEPQPAPLRQSTWTAAQNLRRVLWATLARPVWALLPSLRPALIRLFGGRVGQRCRFARRVDIAIPWNLTLGDEVEVSDGAILYGLGPITIGNRVVLDVAAHLCAGTHDMNEPTFPLLTQPITIGDDTLIGLDAFVGPGVTLGARCRVWPRASVYKSFPDHSILRGNPARAVEPEPGRAT